MPPKRKQPIEPTSNLLSSIEAIVERALLAQKKSMDDMITAKVDEACSTLERNIICLENQNDSLQEALQSLTERGVQQGESTVSSGTVPSITVPKAVSYKDKKLEIAILLLKQVEGLSETDKEAMMENLNRSALSVCRVFASQNHMGTQMSMNFRTERQNAEAKKIIDEYHYQMTP
ncbi:uncharacterized protein EV154DRAFT_488385 [Mucor mucedo]|uniref:uncharacterized protein n=1 Tax=Mucor mucedo TaxID=29922 RepID=UPI002220EC03|nr:uncharacterized protein EV154DRAFT_488385 [Mucor mucedo]KAI7867224.1 hypothetical protein EV154DRAFT_488385 [Mucor mucedo]